MSRRGLILGLLGAIFISSGGVLNGLFLGLEDFTSGHLLPIIVVGMLLLFVVFINPLLLLISPRAGFKPRDMAVIVLLWSTSCSIPGFGLLNQFTHVMVMPYHWYRIYPGWQREKVLQYVPKSCLVEVNDDTYESVVTTYINGTTREQRGGDSLLGSIKGAIRRVPWRAWRRPLLTWLPAVLLMTLASVCLALITYQQWSEHEHLAFPIAEFTSSLIEREPGRFFPAIFRNRLFWVGLLLLFLIRVNNGLCVWYPEYFIPVQLKWNMMPFAKVWPALFRVQWGYDLLRLSVFPLVVAFAYFLSTEISFTLGISQFCWLLLGLPLMSVGINLSTDWIGGWQGWQRCGAWLAFSVILLYTGREYYSMIARKALFLRKCPSTDKDIVNVRAMRILILSFAGMTVLFVVAGLEIPFALVTALLVLLPFVVVARISAETGLFFIQPRWVIFGVLSAGLGGFLFNPSTHVTCAFICAFLCMDHCQAFLPFLTNGLRICDTANVGRGRAGTASMAAYALAAIIAVCVILVGIYGYEGVRVYQSWQYHRLPTMMFRSSLPDILQLRAIGTLDLAESLPWWRRLSGIAPRPHFMGAFIFGVVSVLACSALRLRLPKWPLHPVMFLLWATWPMMVFGQSIFIGWMIKKSMMHFGGIKFTKSLKPLMFGVIAGEVLAAISFMIVGAVYYWHTGNRPLPYRWFP